MPASVKAIYVAGEACNEPKPQIVAMLEAGRGVVGDRYHARAGTFSEKLKASQDWEVTLIEHEEIERFCATQPRPIDPGAFRRNVVTIGVRLNDLVGQQFQVGETVLEGVRLCEPCAHLASWLGPEVVKGMAHRAGLRARIVTGGQVKPGDEVVPRDV